MNNFQKWLVDLTGEESLWIIELFLIVLVALSLGYILNRVIDRLEAHAAKTKTVWDDAFIEACRKPLVWLVWILGINFAAAVAAERMESPMLGLIDPVNRLAIIVLGALFLNNFIKRAERNLISPEFISDPVDPTTVRVVAKLLRVSVIITAVLIAMQLFGYSISGLLAFGGIGGIAVGFAAKDLLANFFGGLMIYLDRPFSVGDWIRSPDREIEGTVENIGFRSTSIRKFDKSLAIIPNFQFAENAVVNVSETSNWLISWIITLQYDTTVDQLKTIRNEIEAYINKSEDFDVNVGVAVRIDKFSDSSIDMYVRCFTKTNSWNEMLSVKERLAIEIKQIVEKNKAAFAFPSQSIYIEKK